MSDLHPQFHASQVKAVSSETLEELNARSVARGYNRVLDPDVLDRLDPRGAHVLASIMVHTMAAGRPCEPHHRCMVMMKLVDLDITEPYESTLDVDMDVWPELKSMSDLLHELGDESEG